jgi:hypothetical protein
MKRSVALCFAVLLLSAMTLAQQSDASATPWRDGKAMSSPGQLTGEVPKPLQPPNEIQNYAPYSIALLPDKPGEVVLPFITTENKLAFFTLSEVQRASNDKKVLGRLISYGELIALIGDLQIQVNQLKQENEKLWAAVGKPSAPQTVVVQPASQAPQSTTSDALSKYLLLRQLFPSPTVPVLKVTPPILTQPPPRAPSFNCTTTYIGSQAYTNCN